LQTFLPQPAAGAVEAVPDDALVWVVTVWPWALVWIAVFETVGALAAVFVLPQPTATTAIAPIATVHAAAFVTERT
jgi:hypothetical protein